MKKVLKLLLTLTLFVYFFKGTTSVIFAENPPVCGTGWDPCHVREDVTDPSSYISCTSPGTDIVLACCPGSLNMEVNATGQCTCMAGYTISAGQGCVPIQQTLPQCDPTWNPCSPSTSITANQSTYLACYNSRSQQSMLCCPLSQHMVAGANGCTCMTGYVSAAGQGCVPSEGRGNQGGIGRGSVGNNGRNAVTGAAMEVNRETLDALNPLTQLGDPATTGQLNTPGAIISRFLTVFAFPIAGLILFIMLVWGGFEILSGAASKKSMDAGKQRIQSALLGFFLLFISYWIVQLIEYVFGVTIL